MGNDLNLLFAVLALQSGLINSDQFIESCTLWTTRKGTPLPDLLLERGWIVAGDVAHIQYLVDRKLEKHGGDAKLSLAAIDDDLKRELAAIDDVEICQSLGYAPAPGESASSVVTLDVPPGRAERYSLIRLHATGGGGRVWLAHDSQLDREVALKELRPEAAADGALWARFQREARVTRQLEHPGIVPVYEYGRQTKQRPFYTMRFVKGRTLAEAAREYHRDRMSGHASSLQLVTLLNAFTTVCNTIAYAHSRGVIHRDLKGQNVVFGDFGEVVVLDWGLAKLVNEPEQNENAEYMPQHTSEFNLNVTLRTGQPCTNVVMGIRKPDGTLNWISINSEPLIRADGSTVYGVLATFADITEIKRTRELLRQKSQQLEEAELQIRILKHAKGAG